jgi:glycosyltransferase involved in cell wall biosynthesis
MRICLVGPAYPYRGGIAHYTSLLAREFDADHDVKIVNFSRLYPSFLFPGKTQYDTSDSPLRVDTDRIIDCLNPVSWIRAGRTAAAFRPDLTVAQWWHPFFGPAYRTMCRSLRSRCATPVIFLCHNVLPHESSVFDRVLIKTAFGGADAFLVQSNEDGANLRTLRPEPVMAVNPLPIYDFFDAGRFDRESAREKLGLEGPVILFFGYIRGYKGLADLIEAMPHIVDRVPVTLLVVGEFYDKREPYDRRIEELSLGRNIRIVDEYVPNEDVEIYFKASDLCVLPYRSATQSAIVQTAYGFDKPVVVTAVGGLPDVVTDGETGFVVPRGDTRGLADAVVRFFGEDAGGRMSANIRAGADRFSWRRCAEKLVELAQEAGKRV